MDDDKRLRLNPSKTEIIWLGSSRRLKRCPMESVCISGAWIQPAKQVRDLGVILDGELTMIPHVNKLVSVCYFHIRQLRTVRRSLTLEAAHALVRALIHTRLDYCNSVLVGLPNNINDRLQSVLRSAARLVLRLPSRCSVFDRMTQELHWLGFPERPIYKIATLAFKCLHRQGPPYLARRLVRVSDMAGRSHLRSASHGNLVVPYTKTVTFGNRSFSYAGPVVLNMLSEINEMDLSLQSFKKELKTALFRLDCGSSRLRGLRFCDV